MISDTSYSTQNSTDLMPDIPYCTQRPDGLILSIRVLPDSKRNKVEGVWNNSHLKIALSAPAIDGKANDSLINFLKKSLKIKQKDIEILSGHTARCKIIRLIGLTKESLPKDFFKTI